LQRKGLLTLNFSRRFARNNLFKTIIYVIEKILVANFIVLQ
jgi:hypothetical protein